MRGKRKFLLGLLYLVGCFATSLLAVHARADAGVISAVAAAQVSIAPGLGVIIWGNVQEHRAANGQAG